MYVNTPMMWNFGFENRVHWPTPRPSFKILLFQWKWTLISIDFGRTILLQNQDMGSKKLNFGPKGFSPVTAVFSTSGATVLGKIHWDWIAVNSIIVKPPRVMIDSRTRNEAASDDWFSNRKRNATITSTRQSKLKSLIKAPSTSIRRFLYPQIFLCGYKNICVHT